MTALVRSSGGLPNTPLYRGSDCTALMVMPVHRYKVRRPRPCTPESIAEDYAFTLELMIELTLQLVEPPRCRRCYLYAGECDCEN